MKKTFSYNSPLSLSLQLVGFLFTIGFLLASSPTFLEFISPTPDAQFQRIEKIVAAAVAPGSEFFSTPSLTKSRKPATYIVTIEEHSYADDLYKERLSDYVKYLVARQAGVSLEVVYSSHPKLILKSAVHTIFTSRHAIFFLVLIFFVLVRAFYSLFDEARDRNNQLDQSPK